MAFVGLAVIACSPGQTSSTTTGTGGQSGGTGGAASSGGSSGDGTGGDSGSGGASASGGSPGSGGDSGSGTGGSTSGSGGGSGGASSSGGATGTGGSTSTGGITGGGGATTTADFTVDVHLASEFKADAAGTIGIVTWSVDVASLVSAQIEFGLDTNYGFVAPVDLSAADHRTLLLGMKPSKMYHFRVIARDATTTYASSDHTVMTGPKTTLVPLSVYDAPNPTALARGFIMSSYWSGSGKGVVFIFDSDGDIVWWYASALPGIARARMSVDAKSMWIATAGNTGAPLERVSMDTLESQTYPNAIGSHDITPVSGSTMAFLEYGESDCNSIFEIDPSGTTKEVFEAQGVVTGTGCHGNAVRYSQKEDVYTYSDMMTDVYVVERATGKLLWKLSDKVSGGHTTWGGVNHGHQLLDNSILIFANRVASNQSAAIEYSLTGQELQRFVPDAYTANLGDVQRLPNGNTLVTVSNASIIKEFDAQANVVLTVNAGTLRLGYALWVDDLYGPPGDISR